MKSLDAHEEAVKAFEKLASKKTMDAVKDGAEPFSPQTYNAIKSDNVKLAQELASFDATEMNIYAEMEGCDYV